MVDFSAGVLIALWGIFFLIAAILIFYVKRSGQQLRQMREQHAQRPPADIGRYTAYEIFEEARINIAGALLDLTALAHAHRAYMDKRYTGNFNESMDEKLQRIYQSLVKAAVKLDVSRQAREDGVPYYNFTEDDILALINSVSAFIIEKHNGENKEIDPGDAA